MAGNYLPGVRQLYEAFPFPARDPDSESATSIPVSRPDMLAKLNHHCFAGRRDFSGGFRALVAGGGTGDAAIFLALQLRGTDAEVVCLDLSEASLAVAQRRAALRGLERCIRWVQGSILDLSTLGLGRFDYISCLGVLHHLAEPEQGLAALAGALAEGGAMALMLYGRYGRQDVYAVQALIRAINGECAELPTQLANLKAALASLPPAHPLMRGRSREHIEALLGNDANLVDTFLHVQDRAYAVPELHGFLASAGLALVAFTNFGRTMPLEYEPEIYLADPRLRAEIAARPAPERQAIAELLHGHMYAHAFYVAKSGQAAADFRDPEMVPFFLTEPGARAAAELIEAKAVTVRLSSRATHDMVPSQAALACLRLVDGERALERIWREAAATLGGDAEALAAAAAPDFERMNALNWLCLRHRTCPPPPPIAYGFQGDAAALKQ